MALPKAYLTSTKNLQDILTSIQQAQVTCPTAWVPDQVMSFGPD